MSSSAPRKLPWLLLISVAVIVADRVTKSIVSTHIMDEAERCGRLAFLREGRKLIEGSPQHLKQTAGKSTLEEAYMYFSEARDGP